MLRTPGQLRCNRGVPPAGPRPGGLRRSTGREFFILFTLLLQIPLVLAVLPLTHALVVMPPLVLNTFQIRRFASQKKPM
jgi:hypothetical protein